MADTVTTQILIDGPRNAVVKLTNVSDGAGESAVVKIDPATLSGSPSSVSIEHIRYVTVGMSVSLYWQASTNVLAWAMAADLDGEIDAECFGGIPNNAGAGKTGRLVLTTTGHSSGDIYALILSLKKKWE